MSLLSFFGNFIIMKMLNIYKMSNIKTRLLCRLFYGKGKECLQKNSHMATTYNKY